MTVPSTVSALKSPDTAAVGAHANKPMTEPSHSAQAPGHTVPADADTPKSAPSTSRVANTLSFLSQKALSLLNMRRGSNMSAAPAPAQSRLIPLRLRTRQHPPSLPQLPSNRIHTAKYSVWTFLPKNMFEQFRRLANFYFLFLVILQCFPAFNVTDPIYAAMPIIFIVTVTAIKDAIEDYKRHRSDRTINNIEAQCLMVGERRKALSPEEPWWHRFIGARRSDVTADPFAPIAMEISSASVAPAPTLQSANDGGSGLASPIGSRKGTKEDDPVLAAWQPTPWADLQVGDIVLLRNNDAIPADMVVLSTSEAEVLCYIETKNLDGETNLKIRSGFAATSGLTTPESMVGWRARVEMEGPNVNLYTSNGVLVVEEERKRRETAVTRRRSSEAAQRRSVLVEKITESVLEQRGMATVSEAEETPVAEAAGPGKLAVITTLPSTPSPVLADGVHGDDAPLSPAEGTPRALTLDLDRPSHSRSASEERRRITFSHLRANSDENSRQNRSNIGSPLARHSVLASTSASSMDPASPRSPASIRDVQTLPISINNLLLRGCTLRNTEWVIGIVVYTGVDTKLLLNSGATPSKRSMIEVFANFLVVVLLCAIIAIGQGASQSWFAAKNAPFILEVFYPVAEQPSSFYVAFMTFWASLILLQNIVPISLYVTAEIVKTTQAYFIWRDVEMYYEPIDAPCTPKTWTIADDLGAPSKVKFNRAGQIEYIFSDKTGTLTRNIMEFRKCTIGGISYGGYHTPDNPSIKPVTPPPEPKGKGKQKATDEGGAEALQPASSEESMADAMGKFYANPYISEKVSFVDENFVRDLFADTDQSDTIKDFFTHVSVCHTVLAEYPEENNDFRIVYQAQSPDEAALVTTAKDVGFTFIDRMQSVMSIDALGTMLKFEVLEIIEFNSTRKRMSTIARTEDGTIVLYCKGADTVVYERLAEGQDELKNVTMRHLEGFADEGLRTLVLAYRMVSEEEFVAWHREYRAANASIVDREKLMDECAEKIEKNLVLLGATAIEDRLQDGVPECIARLSKAGIKIWVLTGDKMETAINIGFSCNLLTRQMTLIVIKGKDVPSTRFQIVTAMRRCFGVDPDNGATPHDETLVMDEEILAPQDDSGPKVFALIIDGNSLKYALEKPCKKLLLELACYCKAVICCRVSPLQKAQVVAMVKNGKRVMTLAVGDGANDVSMIHEANVGIGIQGQEGMQAVMASDYAIGQFRFLTRLLLVHGHWAYARTAEMTLLMFYKNMSWTLVLFWFQIYCSFTAALNYDYFYLLFYNLVFTSLPPIILGIFDQDLNDKYAIAAPQVYKRGIRKELYNLTKFALYTLDGIYQALVCYYVAHFTFNDAVVDGSGYSADISCMGTLSAILAITTANLYAGLNAYHWTWLFHFAVWQSNVIFFLFIIIYSFWPGASLYGVVLRLFTLPMFWLAFPLGIIIAFMPRYMIKFIRAYLRPNDVDILREIEKYRLDDRAVFEQTLESRAPIITDGQPGESVEMKQRNLTPSYSNLVNAAQKINNSVDRFIVDPLKRQFQNLRLPHLQRNTSLLFMRTGKTRSNTGFAFSQEPGVAEHLSQLSSPATETGRRRLQPGRFMSMSGLDDLKNPPRRPATAPTRSMQNLGHRRSFDAGVTATRPPWWKTPSDGDVGSSRHPNAVMSAPTSPIRESRFEEQDESPPKKQEEKSK